MREFEDIKIKFLRQVPAKDRRLRSIDFAISREAEDSWIECFQVACSFYLTKEGPFGKDGVFIDPELGLTAQQINPPEGRTLKGIFPSNGQNR